MLHIIQNDPRVPAGVFGEILRQRNLPCRTVHPYAGEALPSEGTAVIVLGGTMGVHDESAFPFLLPLKDYLRRSVEVGTPLLGVCLGGQLLAEVTGGRVTSRCRGEKGLQDIRLTAAGQNDPLFADFPPIFTAFGWHNDSFEPPVAALQLAFSTTCPGQAFRVGNAWGVQFHPEVDGEIVAAWSAKVDPEGCYAAEFAAAEVGHRAMARQLLENFLASAGVDK
jgi:GMP synthase-like glutamine amidotransferase